MDRRIAIIPVIVVSMFLVVSTSAIVSANDQCSFDNYKSSTPVIDRDIDVSGSGAVDSASFTVYALDNDGILGSGTSNENAISSVTIEIEDSNGNLRTTSANFDNAYLGDNVCLFENFVWNPSDTMDLENLGQTTVRVEVLDNAGYQDNLAYTTENAPSVVEWYVDSISYVVSEIDRDIDYENYNVNDNTRITVKASLYGHSGQTDNVTFISRDGNDSEIAESDETVANSIDDNTAEYVLNFNCPDDIPDDNLGSFEHKIEVENTVSGVSVDGEQTWGQYIAVYDLTTTLSIPSDVTTNEEITVSGTADMIGGTLTLDNAEIEDNYRGIKTATIDGDNWTVTFDATWRDDIYSTLKARVLETSSPNIDGQVSDTYYIGDEVTGRYPTPEGELSVSISLGTMKDGQFVQKNSFKSGEEVTIRVYVTRDGSSVSSASVSGSFRGEQVTLSSSSDAGVYVGTFTVSKSVAQGQYLVDVSASESGQSISDSSSLFVEREGNEWWIILAVVVAIALIAGVGYYEKE